MIHIIRPYGKSGAISDLADERHSVGVVLYKVHKPLWVICWNQKNDQKTCCRTRWLAPYLLCADMGSSSTRDGFGRAIRELAEPLSPA